MTSSRRELLYLVGASLASGAARSFVGTAQAQVPSEAKSPPITIVRKGINQEIEVINIDLFEAQAKAMLPDGADVLIANGNGTTMDRS